MSNIGKRIIQIPKNVTIETSEQQGAGKSNFNVIPTILIKGPLGHTTLNIPTGLKINLIENKEDPTNKSILIERTLNFEKIQKEIKKNQLKSKDDNKISKVWGTFRSLIMNTIIGVSQGFQVNLKIIGVGYRASIERTRQIHEQGNLTSSENEENEKVLVLKLGFSHLVNLNIPKTISITCPKPNRLILRSNNLGELMQYAAKIRSYKQPEPYKGKGILYKGEKIRRKEGKKK